MNLFNNLFLLSLLLWILFNDFFSFTLLIIKYLLINIIIYFFKNIDRLVKHDFLSPKLYGSSHYIMCICASTVLLFIMISIILLVVELDLLIYIS